MSLGPWTSKLASGWFKPKGVIPTILGQRYTHVNIRPTKDVTPEAIFFEYSAKGKSTEPELYPRADGEVYVCGLPERPILIPDEHDNPADVLPRKADVAYLTELAGSMSSTLSGAKVMAEESCYLPIPPDGTPIIGALEQCSGAYIATGHSCWGILNGPATGEAMAQLLLDGRTDIDLTPFNPSRFNR